ncbi:MAG: type IV pilus modification protein PilV [Granulosicoccus sp.]
MNNVHPTVCKNIIIRSRQRGVGLLEVLVALIVISFGVLGMAGLQLTGMKQSTSGFNRAKAVMLAESMTARMRLNRTGVANEFYNGFDSINLSCDTQPDPYCQSYGATDARICTAEELADFDMFSVACGEWNGQSASGGIEEMLPDGASLAVSCDDVPCTNESSYTLSVTWPENPNASSAEPTQSSRVQMRLRP